MIRMIRTALLAFTLLLATAVALPGCIEASQEPVDYPAVAVASARGNGPIVVSGWSIVLSRADVAVGPFYFCAAASGSATLCESSIAEVANVTVVNALGLASAPAPIGTVRGFSGPIQSASYDFGISWFPTQTSPTPASSLPGGHSIRLEGEASKGAVRIPFTADVDVVPQFQGQNAIATSPAIANVGSSATRLEVVLDPAAWLPQVDFDAIAAEVAMTRVVPFAIVPGTGPHNAVLVGLKILAPLQLRWVPVTP